MNKVFRVIAYSCIFVRFVTMARKRDDMAQVVEQGTAELEVPGLNPATGEFFCGMLQRVTSNSGNI